MWRFSTRKTGALPPLNGSNWFMVVEKFLGLLLVCVLGRLMTDDALSSLPGLILPFLPRITSGGFSSARSDFESGCHMGGRLETLL
jgi:hypothetical protein